MQSRVQSPLISSRPLTQFAFRTSQPKSVTCQSARKRPVGHSFSSEVTNRTVANRHQLCPARPSEPAAHSARSGGVVSCGRFQPQRSVQRVDQCEQHFSEEDERRHRLQEELTARLEAEEYYREIEVLGFRLCVPEPVNTSELESSVEASVMETLDLDFFAHELKLRELLFWRWAKGLVGKKESAAIATGLGIQPEVVIEDSEVPLPMVSGGVAPQGAPTFEALVKEPPREWLGVRPTRQWDDVECSVQAPPRFKCAAMLNMGVDARACTLRIFAGDEEVWRMTVQEPCVIFGSNLDSAHVADYTHKSVKSQHAALLFEPDEGQFVVAPIKGKTRVSTPSAYPGVAAALAREGREQDQQSLVCVSEGKTALNAGLCCFRLARSRLVYLLDLPRKNFEHLEVEGRRLERDSISLQNCSRSRQRVRDTRGSKASWSRCRPKPNSRQQTWNSPVRHRSPQPRSPSRDDTHWQCQSPSGTRSPKRMPSKRVSRRPSRTRSSSRSARVLWPRRRRRRSSKSRRKSRQLPSRNRSKSPKRSQKSTERERSCEHPSRQHSKMRRLVSPARKRSQKGHVNRPTNLSKSDSQRCTSSRGLKDMLRSAEREGPSPRREHSRQGGVSERRAVRRWSAHRCGDGVTRRLEASSRGFRQSCHDVSSHRRTGWPRAS